MKPSSEHFNHLPDKLRSQMMREKHALPVVLPPRLDELRQQRLTADIPRQPRDHHLDLDRHQSQGARHNSPLARIQVRQERLDKSQAAPLIRHHRLPWLHHEHDKVIHEKHWLPAIAPLPLAFTAPPLPVDTCNAKRNAPFPFEIGKHLVQKSSGPAEVNHELPDTSRCLAPLPRVAGWNDCPAEEAELARGTAGRRS